MIGFVNRLLRLKTMLRTFQMPHGNVVAIHEGGYANVDKQRTLFADNEVRSRSHDISMFCIKKCMQPEMLLSS